MKNLNFNRLYNGAAKTAQQSNDGALIYQQYNINSNTITSYTPQMLNIDIQGTNKTPTKPH
jgi:aspartate 1-decarboxylase